MAIGGGFFCESWACKGAIGNLLLTCVNFFSGRSGRVNKHWPRWNSRNLQFYRACFPVHKAFIHSSRVMHFSCNCVIRADFYIIADGINCTNDGETFRVFNRLDIIYSFFRDSSGKIFQEVFNPSLPNFEILSSEKWSSGSLQWRKCWIIHIFPQHGDQWENLGFFFISGSFSLVIMLRKNWVSFQAIIFVIVRAEKKSSRFPLCVIARFLQTPAVKEYVASKYDYIQQ